MNIEPDQYRRAALERLEQARLLYRRDPELGRPVRTHSLAMYAAGVAVECMLLAYITRRSRKFDGRHLIERLYNKSRLWRIDASASRRKGLSEKELEKLKRELDVAIHFVHRLWWNDYRYASEDRLKRFLFSRGEHKDIKGDIVKENLRRLIDAASKIVSKGDILWDNASNSRNG